MKSGAPLSGGGQSRAIPLDIRPFVFYYWHMLFIDGKHYV